MVLSQGNILNCRWLFHRLLWVLWHLIPAFLIALPSLRLFNHQSFRGFTPPFYTYRLINFSKLSISANNIQNRISDSARFIKQAFAYKSVINVFLYAEYWLMHNNYIYPRNYFKRLSDRLHVYNDYYSAHLSAVQ